MISLCILLLLGISNMSAQVYYMQQRGFKKISRNLLECINEMGLDSNVMLTELKGRYFNALYQINEPKFSLCDKKVCFFTGSLGKTKSDKKVYFTGERSRFRQNDSPTIGTLYIFNAVQKEQSGGYDAAIVYWNKRLVPIEEVVKRLNKN